MISASKRSICMLPSGEMLRLKPVSHWIKRFQEFTRQTPQEISLPAVGFVGPTYDSHIHPYSKKYEKHNILPLWVKDARKELGENATIWASIVVDGNFLDNEALWVRNQYQDDLAQLCITNPVSQEVLTDFINEIITLGGIDGIVLDITDAFPNSGSSIYTGLSSHCFCDYCVQGLRLNGFKEGREVFAGTECLLRLVLRVDEDGTSHIDPLHEWIDTQDANSLVTFSIARNFVSGERASLEKEALRLLKYLEARVKLTAESVKSIFSVCKENNIRSAVIMNSQALDLTQMTTLSAMDHSKSADEYWLPDAPSRDALPGEWQAVQFLSNRSTYNINALFEFVEKAEERAIASGPQRFLALLQQYSKRMMRNKLSAGAVYIVNKLPQYSGYIGVPLGADDHLDMVKRLASEVTGTVLPPDVLDHFRIANPNEF